MDEYIEYKMDEELSKILYENFDFKIVVKVISIYRLMALYSYNSMDSGVLNNLTNKKIDNSGVRDFILDYTKKTTNDLFKENGISLYQEASLDMYLAVLTLFKCIDDLDPELGVKLLEEIDDDSLDNENILAKLIANNYNVKVVESLESLEYVTDYYFDKLSTKFFITDEETNDNRLFILGNKNEGMKKTFMYGMILSGESIKSNINYYIHIVMEKLLIDIKTKPNNNTLTAIAKEIVAILFAFQTDTISMGVLFKENIVDLLYGDLSIMYQDNLAKHINEEIAKVEENTRIYYD